MIEVLRLGHRLVRDYRVSTHVCLTARAFGADKIIFTTEDKTVFETVNKITEQWGGNFKIEIIPNWKEYIKNFDGVKVHLTMYGEEFFKYEPQEYLKKDNLLIIIGAEKVPPEVYELADYNISIGNQPHSEIAALGVFLYYINGNNVLYREFSNANIKIEPCDRGKNVKKLL